MSVHTQTNFAQQLTTRLEAKLQKQTAQVTNKIM